MSPLPPTRANLSVVEFVGSSGSRDDATFERWLEGPSDAVRRLRERVVATGSEGFAAAVVCGEAGSGRLRVASCLHAASRRAAATLAVVDGGQPTAGGSLHAIRQALASGTSTPGNVVIRAVERADPETIAAAVELLTGQGLELRCGVILLTSAPLAALRGRSLQHGQLFARCGRAMLQVPPLAARLSDIPTLARRFLVEATDRFDKTIRGLSPQALHLLQRHDYPGNVRELAGMIEQAVLAGGSDWLTAEDFPRLAQAHSTTARRGEMVIRMPGSSLREIELQALRLALDLTDGRVVRAAELLGITRHALRRKLEKHGLSDLRRATPSQDEEPGSDDDAFI